MNWLRREELPQIDMDAEFRELLKEEKVSICEQLGRELAADLERLESERDKALADRRNLDADIADLDRAIAHIRPAANGLAKEPMIRIDDAVVRFDQAVDDVKAQTE